MILSVFDGIACGYMALKQAGIEFDKYVAYEIDKYAIQTATHNFPDIIEKGDVFDADFTEYRGQVDYLIGGSPCTYWSIAQTNNRETEASGLGWELFSQYVRALKEAEPKYFLYENNKSMSKAIRESITETFGFEPICINSALVSAQNRQRLYWVGKREADGTYSKVHIEQPEDRGILLKDILETGCTYRDISTVQKDNMVAEPVVGYDLESVKPLEYQSDNNNAPIRLGTIASNVKNKEADSQQYREYSPNGKSVTICGSVGSMGKNTGLYAVPCDEPICVNSKSGRNGIDGLQPSLQDRIYSIEGKHTACTTAFMPNVAVPCECKCYAIQCEWNENGEPIKAISCADGKTYTVYKVVDGQITIKGKTYPIKLVDGFYIIRKLTVRECARLQTIPEWYEFACSDSQSYKQIGNGWTIEVIAHLLMATKE